MYNNVHLNSLFFLVPMSYLHHLYVRIILMLTEHFNSSFFCFIMWCKIEIIAKWYRDGVDVVGEQIVTPVHKHDLHQGENSLV